MSRRQQRLVIAGLVLSSSLAACAHRPSPAPSGPTRQFQSEAERFTRIAYEDDFIEARLVFQALPLGSAERAGLRERLLRYLLAPVVTLSAERLRAEVRELESDDVYDRVFESFRDGLGLFDPLELWGEGGKAPVFTAVERDLLGRAARLVMGVYSPRGADAQVALALAALASVEPASGEWPERLVQLIRWSEEASTVGEGGLFRRASSGVDVLESTLGDWPAPAVAVPLDKIYGERQKKFAAILRHPLGGESSRKALGELLSSHGEEMQRAMVNVISLYLRCGQIGRAAERVAAAGEQAGDDPDLRAMLNAAAAAGASAADYLRLARRFLPRIEILGGTATDTPDPLVSLRVLAVGLRRFPADPEMLILSAHIARIMSLPFLAIRQLEEAQLVLENNPAGRDQQAKISAELVELYFVRLQLRLDPERAAPAFDEAESLRRRSAETRQRFQGTEIKVRNADIDFELGRSYVNAGLAERAEPLFLRARSEGEPSADVTTELANLALKRGQPRKAVEILREGLEALSSRTTQQETLRSIQGRPRLQRLLGDAYDVSGDRASAEMAWRKALAGWEQLMAELLRRKNFTPAAEATFEVGRLYYRLGRHSDAIEKFEEALEHDGDRDQSYIDMIAFLVEQGEADAALSIYRRGLSRPNRAVSEYVKVYTSLWVLDLTRRTHKLPDATAESYLRTLDQRHPEIRPHRGAAWYQLLARYAVGKMTYEQIHQAADTIGRQAELYFYEAMRRLAQGKTDDAHQLWQKVIDTKMFSFFEFDMASRYLRLGAPTAPPSERGNVETI